MDQQLTHLLEQLAIHGAHDSILLRLTVVQSPSKLRTDEPGIRIEQEYAARATGQRYFDESALPDRASAPVRRTYYSDGTKCASIAYQRDHPEKQSTVRISRSFGDEDLYGFAEAPWPVRVWHVGLSPLSEVLPQAIRIGEEKVIDRPCVVFHFPNIGVPKSPQSLVYALDQESAIPLKVTAYANPTRIQEKLPNWVWEAKSFDRVAGQPIVLHSAYTTYLQHKSDDGKIINMLDNIQFINITYVEFDTPLVSSRFWPILQPGVVVRDAVANRTFTVAGQSPEAMQQSIQTGTPIRVHEIGHPEYLWMSIGIGMSICLLLAAWLLWRRSS